MKKVDGVETVRVSLKEGLTILDLKPGNTVTLSRLRTVIKNNGFVSKETTVVARGRVVSRTAAPPAFEVSGTNEVLAPATEPQRVDESWRFTVKN